MLQHRAYHLFDTVFRPFLFPGVIGNSPFLEFSLCHLGSEEGKFIHSVEFNYLHLAKGTLYILLLIAVGARHPDKVPELGLVHGLNGLFWAASMISATTALPVGSFPAPLP